ncbi:hypothetical protein CH333_03830 [candidate division WOR-3 bacterium JGI_Cruoil_03_44_89]|uniref:PorV/PorQ family protein n=1 Tax=candidate division WOR-3 bacterium JGI_Cruoil_03_44_89 TaxID=1973748 RepID=A0A235BVQ1_UNCW3|nr:MAG: hypothetical protein CH333_03830 [candidate division WOR-3 bacterium JGI_Cruoil_03_44_89]
MKRFIVIAILFPLVAGVGFSAEFSKIGTAGAQFLKIGAEPRGMGMGGACVAVITGAPSIYWNPAGIAFSNNLEFLLSDVEWVYDIRNNFLSCVIPGLPFGNLGISITALTMGEEDVTTVDESEGTGETWGAQSIAATISWGRMLTDKFAFGINVKLLQEKIWDMTANGLAFDIGSYLTPGYWGNLRLAFVLTNFGPDMQFEGGQLVTDITVPEWPPGYVGPMPGEFKSASYALPVAITLGLAYDVIDTPGNRWTFAFDLKHSNDGAEKYRMGTEYAFSELLFLRAGYEYDPDIPDEDRDEDNLQRLTFGVGLNPLLGGSPFNINYGYQDLGLLGIGHRLSVGMSF